MSLSSAIQTFLSTKFKKCKITRKDFIQKSGVSDTHTSLLLNNSQQNPAMINIIKIANYFNCSIDEIIGRNVFIKPGNYKNLSEIEMNSNVKLFIIQKLKDDNVTAYSLEKKCCVGRSTILNFISDSNIQRSLRTTTIIAIANYFKTSIDEMLGRIV